MIIEIEKSKGSLIDRLSKGKQISEQELQGAFSTGTGKLWRKAIDNTPTATGDLAKSITRELTPTYAKIYPQFAYGLFVHNGTRPHWIPKRELEPGGTMFRWFAKRGITDKRHQFMILRSIARKGTKAQPWMADTFNKEWPEIEKLMISALDNIVNRLAK